ncbi:MAG: S8 family serine peptidase [Acidobacteriota bacterium]|nr:S8 family serine peptidase [Acidobacteriota bacterium]
MDRRSILFAVFSTAAAMAPSAAEVPSETPKNASPSGRWAVAERLGATLDDVVAKIEGRAPRDEASERASVFVELAPGHDRSHVKEFARARGGFARYEYTLLPRVLNLRGVPREEIDALRALPGVVRVVEDHRVRVHLNDSTPHVRALQGQVQAAGLSVTGAGARVCVIDTGIDPDHTMFASRIDAAAGYDFVNDDADPADDHGHGSHVAGIALGRTGFDYDFGNGLVPVQGVAPGAALIGVKVLDSGGSGNLSDVVAGIEHCADPLLPGGAADVINMSLGAGLYTRSCDDDFVAIASNAAVDAGVVVVASAGNNGSSNGIGAPACATKVIAVAAAYDDDYPNPDDPTRDSFSFIPICSDTMPNRDDLACFSNRSPHVDVAGPGCLTSSADGLESSGAEVKGLCGTSMSAPHVAGLAAMLRELDPLSSPSDVRDAIRGGAADLGAPGYDTGYGFGRIDVVSSLKLASTCGVGSDCDDGNFCNGVEQCSGGSCESGSVPCPGQLCDEAADACAACTADTNCDDGIVCNGVETCDAGVCLPGPLGCVSVCDAINNSCVECLDDGDCDDADYCNGVETCSPQGSCVTDLRDCNENWVEDYCDIAQSTSADVAPQNGVPDECDALVRYTISEIPSLGGDRALAFGINDAGHVVGLSETGDAAPTGLPIEHAFLWDGSSTTDLGTLGGENSLAYDVNNAGTVVGQADLAVPLAPPPFFAPFKNVPTRWDSGVPTQLDLLPDFGYWNGGALAISDTDFIGGRSINGFELIRGTLWGFDPERPLEVLAMPGADMTDVWGIADSGETVGWMNEMYLGFNRKAFRLPMGSQTPVDIGTLGGAWGWALDINKRGDIVGQSSDATGLLRPFVLESGQPMTDLGSLGGSFALARAINDSRQVVGDSTHPLSLTLSDTLAFVWEAGVLEELNDLIPGNLGWNLREAWDINDSGQIAGHGLNAQNAERAFRLDPCGAPGSPCFVTQCSTAAECDDGVFCNGVETCPAGFCVAAAPPACDDADSCTIDFCDSGLDACRSRAPAIPAAPGNLLVELSAPGSTSASLTWDPVPAATSYNVYRSSQPALGDISCLLSGVTQPPAIDDGALPQPGGALVYLVTGASCSGESGLGQPGRPVPPTCGP